MVTSSPVSRCATVALAGFTALSLVACGSSGAPAPSATGKASSATSATTSPSSLPQASGKGAKDRASGLVGSVSGGTVTLTAPHGPGTVAVTPSTRVTELTPGQLTDVTAGLCVVVWPTKQGGGATPATAAAVMVGQPNNGKCGGRGRGLMGTVTSVNGNSIVLTTGDNDTTTVTVTADTRYAKRSATTTSAIAAGLCLSARGSKDSSGTLQATAVALRPSKDGQCGGGRHQGG